MAGRSIRTKTPTLDIYIKLAQYPILADRIRTRMREELFARGMITEEAFEEEVKKKAIESQKTEGLHDPFHQEPATVWEQRKNRIRDFHTDFTFAHNFPPQVFEDIVYEVLTHQHTDVGSRALRFNPELAPWEMLFRQGKLYEELEPGEREQYKHHLEEIKVVLLKGMVSEQLRYIGVAKKVFTIEDLHRIFLRRIGGGKIGGKAAGMLLAWKILRQQSPDYGPDISESIEIPDSYFLGTDVIYEFRTLNNLDHLMTQKYRAIQEIRTDYPQVVQAHLEGEFPDAIVSSLRTVLEAMGDSPLIVRSSSLLEDNFGNAFAGKYNSYFCPNQGSPDENLHDLLSNIKRVYASTLNPDAILYRRRHDLIDYDERMAILIQRVRGRRHGRYFYPSLAGVGFSQNPFRWNKKIRREDGFLRLVLGMGTRAVDRVDRDYPRMIALSHPRLRPETTPKAIRQYSQHYIDVIDLEQNDLRSLPIADVIATDFPDLRYVASVHKDGYLQNYLSTGSITDVEDAVLTFDYLTKDQKFVRLMRSALIRLEQSYGTPVDIEFTIDIIPNYPYPDYKLHVLQCRPLSQRASGGEVSIPRDIPAGDILFSTFNLVPDGKVEGIRYVIFVDPILYRQIPSQTIKLELGRAIGRLNTRLEHESFIIMGPGRWGSANLELGVRVTYADIHNTKVLIEMSVLMEDGVPDLSYGTHFFQDLVEAGIHSLPLHLEDPRSNFDWAFFRNSPNQLVKLSPPDGALDPYLRVIDVARETANRRLNIYMDGSADEAMAFLASSEWRGGNGQGTLSSF
ncbi:MAG: PEP/pyruvate-binding domain-containing protein [Anaerolineales bacterium]|nr:PEP/pyruvate-binding domain-containing protein [Anaerolineales bacterium]MCB8953462.1 PEP/pyruvate-binding domain-containing protein [Ardenticatenales bacterium]